MYKCNIPLTLKHSQGVTHIRVTESKVPCDDLTFSI